MLEGGATAVQADDDVVGVGRVRELERMLGRKIMEVEILKKALNLAAPKSQCCGSPRSTRTVCREDGGGHSRRLTLQSRRTSKKHSPESPVTRKLYTRAEDVVVLPVIRRLVDQRPTYGYRRITALLNRKRRGQGLPPVNASLSCVPISAGARTISNSNAATAISSASCSSSMPVTVRSSHGRPSPMSASQARWCAV